MLGSVEAVRAHAQSAVDAAEPLFTCIEHPSMPVQIGMQLLRQCALPKLSFLARTIPPDQLREAAAAFDRRVTLCFNRLMKISDASRPEDTSAEQLSTQISLPIKAGGMGLRPLQRVSHAAYFASAAAIMPEFIKAFPPTRCADYTTTNLHSELSACLTHLQQAGVGTESSKPVRRKPPTTPGPRRVHSANPIPTHTPTLHNTSSHQQHAVDDGIPTR